MAGKRGNSEGTIRKRGDGRWEARLVLEDGTRKSLYGKTRQEVARLLARALQDRERGVTALGERQTVEQYFTSWLDTMKHRVKPSAHMRYDVDVRLHIKPALGKIALSKLTAQHIQAFYARKMEDGLSKASVYHIHIVVHAALENAVRLGLLHRNVADMADPPRMQRRKKMQTLSEQQARTLIAAAAEDRLGALCVLALATGMREGELMALKWDDVDLEGASLQVRATMQRTPQGFVRDEPKTLHSGRRIALSATAVEALRRHRVCQLEERLKMGEAWRDLSLVFPDPAGGQLTPDNFQRNWFDPLLKRADLPRIRFHDLRHTAATLLLARGINPKVVSEMLGHSGVSITLGLYGHVTPHMQQQAAEAMDKMLGG